MEHAFVTEWQMGDSKDCQMASDRGVVVNNGTQQGCQNKADAQVKQVDSSDVADAPKGAQSPVARHDNGANFWQSLPEDCPPFTL